ncbi:MAG: hypothetical protein JWR89_3523 [Tardiphaga sp.]|nr:hypothetical protein [Tardiphaga sp.]
MFTDMAERPTDVTLDILIKIQEGIGALRSELGEFRLAADTRFERIETVMHKQRRDSAGMLVMMRATVTDFDERVSDVEERVAALEAETTA